MRSTTCHVEERSQSSGLLLRYNYQPLNCYVQKFQVVYPRLVVYTYRRLMFVQALYFKKYSTASDVWSYGLVLYEVWTLGTKPVECINNLEVFNSMHICTHLRSVILMTMTGHHLHDSPESHFHFR